MIMNWRMAKRRDVKIQMKLEDNRILKCLTIPEKVEFGRAIQ